MSAAELVILAFATVGLLIFSWQFSVRARRYHGVFRFFAFETIIVLLLLNWRLWFVDPFGVPQVISWIFLFCSIPFGLAGTWLLLSKGKPVGQFENTTSLVTTGIYRFVRHPLYASLMLLALGIFFKNISWVGAVLAAGNMAAILATGKTEEKEMVGRFGDSYVEYMKSTKMFIPYVF